MTVLNHMEGLYYPPFHRGWGSFSEELFYHTSRYYGVTEGFLRSLTGYQGFTMSGYNAANLSENQRPVMAAILTHAPTRDTGLAVISIVEAVTRGDTDVDTSLCERYPPHPTVAFADERPAEDVATPLPLDVRPLEPWLSMAERLLMPVAVRDHHVEVDMEVLARHLDSPNPVIRTNLQTCIMELHEAGYRLRNHPHLTHNKALEIGDEDAV
jgi:hypothetical protein